MEYRGSGILFSTRKGLRKEVTQLLGRFEYLAAKSSPRAFSHLYPYQNFSPPWNISEATKNKALLNPAHLYRYFYEGSKKLFDLDTVERRCTRQFYSSSSACYFFLVSLLIRYAVNRVSVAPRFSLFLRLLFFALSSISSLRLSSRVSRIRSRSLWHSSPSK